mgnify:CR=1 FL=1
MTSLVEPMPWSSSGRAGRSGGRRARRRGTSRPRRAVAGHEAGDVDAVPEAIDGYRGDARLAVGEIVEVGDAIREIGNRSDA